MRTVAGGFVTLGADVIDLVLAFLHARHVIGQRLILFRRIRVCRGEPQKVGNPFPVSRVFRRSFFQYRAKHLPGRGIVLRLVFCEFPEHIQNPARQRAAHGIDGRILLQQLAGDIQRQVVTVGHATNETQVQRQELLRVIHDEHALDV